MYIHPYDTGGQQESYGRQEESYGRQEESYGRQEQSYGRQEQSYGRQEQGQGYGESNNHNNQSNNHGYGESNNQHQSNNQSYGGYQKPDVNEAAQYASNHAPEGAGKERACVYFPGPLHDVLICYSFLLDTSLFSSVLSKLVDRDDDDDDAPHKKQVGEGEAQEAARAHDQIYNQNGGQPPQEVNSRDMGSAAAMQAFKMFSGGGNSGGGSNQLVGLAMGEAMKLFQAQGGSSSGANQGEMLQSAATMAMKLFMTQQSGGSGGSSGGLGSVMSILGSLQGGGNSAPQQQSSGGVAGLLGKFL